MNTSRHDDDDPVVPYQALQSLASGVEPPTGSEWPALMAREILRLRTRTAETRQSQRDASARAQELTKQLADARARETELTTQLNDALARCDVGQWAADELRKRERETWTVSVPAAGQRGRL